ncbi:O-methyltransferase [Microtetraspora sp. NBRC 13810]|uniref:O-methyltransferase n=1 Tax=Microtetraspora sp. NBRC 13810 TaxID=3030990 RepID=UPI002554E99D|nr:O-methyltransferase [Microtetraspora sp. NBRC 13810]
MKATYIHAAVGQYVLAHTTPPDDLLEELTKETLSYTGDDAVMQIDPAQGRFMTMITQLSGAANVVEIGTFTGYSAICLARGLALGGRLTCFDVSHEWTSIARRYWQRAGLADRIDLVIGPAADSLAAFPADPPIDLAFIDADKQTYPVYYDLVMERLAPGGLILVDNTLRDGRVADPEERGQAVQDMRAFNAKVAADPRVTTVLLPVADGLTMIRKS